MNQQQKQQLIDWLSGPRIYSEGAALYSRFGTNLRLKRQFTVEESKILHEMLIDEIRNLAGLTPAQLGRLKRRAYTGSPVPEPRQENDSLRLKIDSLQEENNDLTEEKDLIEDRMCGLEDEIRELKSRYKEVSPSVSKMIGFREKYDFLNRSDCPDELKILVTDMFTALGKYKGARARLENASDSEAEEAAADCEALVENYLDNREIWEELDYYREHGEILGKCRYFREKKVSEDLSTISDVDLMKKLASARANVSKHKKNLEKARENGDPEEAHAVNHNRWLDTLAALEREVERRKKK